MNGGLEVLYSLLLKCYRKCARDLGFTWRRPLPPWVMAKTRNIFPSADGVYMGFKLA
eukprot:SAG11_NODE_20200_length_450_cov_1.908832_2_plen_57_part_00